MTTDSPQGIGRLEMKAAKYAPDIGAVRAFNRFYTKRIGVVQQHILDSDFSLTAMRIFYELNQTDSITAKEIAAMLELDEGYLSRILRKFERDGLIKRKPSEKDARQMIIKVTKTGRKQFCKLDDRSSEEVGTLISQLSCDQRRRLVAAMQTVQSLLDAGDSQQAQPYVLRTHQPGDMGVIVQRHGTLYSMEYGWDSTFEALVAEIAAKFLKEFDARRERCWIAERDGEFLGTVMCVKGDKDGEAKLRLLIVEPRARGLGIGRRLVAECILFARRCGYKRLTLWTQNNLTAAHKIYAEAGFKLKKEESHHSFGHELIGQFWALDLQA